VGVFIDSHLEMAGKKKKKCGPKKDRPVSDSQLVDMI
jgi:hypothetical protein